jgi:hypothetical protein
MRLSSTVLGVLVVVCALIQAHGVEHTTRATKLKARLQSQLASKAAAYAGAKATLGDADVFPLKSANSYQCATALKNHKKGPTFGMFEVVQMPCQGSGASGEATGQEWTLRSDKQIESAGEPTFCMSVLNGQKRAGNKIVLVPCEDPVAGESAATQWSRFEFIPNIRNNHQISFVAKNWTFYCVGINDFDRNIRIYGCDAHHPYQLWKFDSNQYILLPRCNKGDFPEEQVRCGDMVYLYQANSKSVSWVRMPPGNDIDVTTFPELHERKAWELNCLKGQEGDRVSSGDGFCLKQNRRYLTFDGQKHWTQDKDCNLDLAVSEQNIRIQSTDDVEPKHPTNHDAVMYACRSRNGFMRNHVALSGVANGFQHRDQPIWMKVGADGVVRTTVAEKHPETRIYLLPPGY